MYRIESYCQDVSIKSCFNVGFGPIRLFLLNLINAGNIILLWVDYHSTPYLLMNVNVACVSDA